MNLYTELEMVAVSKIGTVTKITHLRGSAICSLKANAKVNVRGQIQYQSTRQSNACTNSSAVPNHYVPH